MSRIGDFMKWSVQQLQKLTTKPYEFEYVANFDELANSVSDIIEIKPVHIKGVISYVKYGTFHINYSVEALLILECSLTLEPVEYSFINDYDEIFSTDPTDDEFLIESNTLDLDMAVWSNIIIDKPIAVKREDAYDILKERGIDLNESFDDEE